MSNKIISTTRQGNALDQFLPERIFVRHGESGNPDLRIDPSEVHLEPIVSRPSASDPSKVQLWPMIAAALVAFGISLLTFAALARYTHFF